MMTALAVVQEVQQGQNGNRVLLSCEQQTSCSHCSSQKSCGTGVVSKAIGNKQHNWWLSTDKSLEAGQVVEIGLPEKQLLTSAAVVYLIPLFGLFAGAALSHLWLGPLTGGGEGFTIVCSFLFALAGFGLARFWARRMEHQSPSQVSLIRVLGEPLVVNAAFDDSDKA